MYKLSTTWFFFKINFFLFHSFLCKWNRMQISFNWVGINQSIKSEGYSISIIKIEISRLINRWIYLITYSKEMAQLYTFIKCKVHKSLIVKKMHSDQFFFSLPYRGVYPIQTVDIVSFIAIVNEWIVISLFQIISYPLFNVQFLIHCATLCTLSFEWHFGSTVVLCAIWFVYIVDIINATNVQFSNWTAFCHFANSQIF